MTKNSADPQETDGQPTAISATGSGTVSGEYGGRIRARTKDQLIKRYDQRILKRQHMSQNTFAYSSFAQNVGLISVTGVRSRYVCAAGGGILILLGLCPKIAGLVAAVTMSGFGGAGFVMLGMIAATGIRILSRVYLTPHRLDVIAISVGVGLIPDLSERFFHRMLASLGA